MVAETLNTTEALQLVLGVARLGENDLRGWWRGHALDKTGRYVLSGMFRRTWRPAALELDVAAAARSHNELLGRSTALHLFSDLLPFRRWSLGWLAEQKTVADQDPLLSLLEGWTTETSTDTLRAWSASKAPLKGEPLGEGLLIGRLTPTDLDDASGLIEVARLLVRAYLDQGKQLRPPYFDLVR